jgi:nucleoside-diphosphate-sugar epimerase
MMSGKRASHDKKGVKMKILVTGCSGFIASHIVDKLLEQGHQVIGVDLWFNEIDLKHHLNDQNFTFIKGNFLKLLNSPAFYKNSFKNIDIIIHLAAILGTSETIKTYDPLLVAETNIIGTLKILKYALNNKVERVIVPSTPDVPWLNPYKITKTAMEKFCKLYFKYYNLKTIVLSLGNVYGPRERWSEVKLMAPYKYQKVVPTFIVNALQNKPLLIYGDGEQRADYIYVEDVVDAFLKAIDSDKAYGHAIPIGSGRQTSVNELADLIIQLTKSKSRKTYLSMREGETPLDIYISPILADELLGFKVRTNLKEGLKKTIPYYQKLLSILHKTNHKHPPVR